MSTESFSSTPWSNERAGAPAKRGFRWSRFLWQLVYPRGGGPRIAPTASGSVLVMLSLGVGVAAYNAANNILFVTLAIMLACLILSGLLSWINFRRLTWRLLLAPPLRAGHDTVVTLELHNAKRLIPVYSLWFELLAVMPAGPAPVEAPPGKRRKRRKAGEVPIPGRLRGRVFLTRRLGPGESVRLDWIFRPERRGLQTIALESVASLFPFGFLRKTLGSDLTRQIVVWPAPVAYVWQGGPATRPNPLGQRVARAGTGGDLHAIRKYEPGDSHRLIHWKASARQGQLLVRQFAAENQRVYDVWVQTGAELWPRAEQFDLMIGFAASLVEDLYRTGRLRHVAVDGGVRRRVSRVRDLEAFLDEISVLEPSAVAGAAPAGPVDGLGRRDLLTFAPDGARGVAAFLDGSKAATA